MALLPNRERAIVDLRKLSDYCLDPTHLRGRHKARVFREALGIARSDASWLREIVLRNIQTEEAIAIDADEFGGRWRVDLTVTRHSRTDVDHMDSVRGYGQAKIGDLLGALMKDRNP